MSIETLARLIDEVPSAEEAAHLDRCDECRAELEGLKADAAAMAGLPEIEPPSTQWLAVESRLAAEGLLRPATRHASHRWFRPLMQAAAAIVIFVVGSYTGSLLGLRAADDTATVASAASVPVTADAAAAAVRAAESSYLTALTRYAELVQRADPVDPLARLAALESIVLTTRAALGQSPADPVINGYHLTALAQRDATIKRLASTSSAGQTWF
ncbi:MAG: hypothetical protein WEE89_05805 [Gemmatimonadota bacterium]